MKSFGCRKAKSPSLPVAPTPAGFVSRRFSRSTGHSWAFGILEGLPLVSTHPLLDPEGPDGTGSTAWPSELRPASARMVPPTLAFRPSPGEIQAAGPASLCRDTLVGPGRDWGQLGPWTHSGSHFPHVLLGSGHKGPISWGLAWPSHCSQETWGNMAGCVPHPQAPESLLSSPLLVSVTQHHDGALSRASWAEGSSECTAGTPWTGCVHVPLLGRPLFICSDDTVTPTCRPGGTAVTRHREPAPNLGGGVRVAGQGMLLSLLSWVGTDGHGDLEC